MPSIEIGVLRRLIIYPRPIPTYIPEHLRGEDPDTTILETRAYSSLVPKYPTGLCLNPVDTCIIETVPEDSACVGARKPGVTIEVK